MKLQSTKYLLLLLALICCLLLLYVAYQATITPEPTPITLPEELLPMAKIDKIVVEKAKRRMTVYHQDIPLRTYRIALGFSPTGHKEQEGDGKTPEGNYLINSKNPHSKFHLSLKISYPSQDDKKAAKAKGVNPGGEIMIHGLGKYLGPLGTKHTLRDWTLGCIAITNEEMEELFPYVDTGTKIEVNP